MVAAAVGLSAAQLFEGFHVAGQEVRNHGASPEFAAIFSFPPINLVTALVPGFFGDMNHFTYWGRFDLWEMSLFFGVTGLVLAVYGAVYGEQPKKRFCGGLAVVFLLVAFGANTPLFGALYRWAPGFGKFRGWSKFIYPATLFLVALRRHRLRRAAARRPLAPARRDPCCAHLRRHLRVDCGLGGQPARLWRRSLAGLGPRDVCHPVTFTRRKPWWKARTFPRAPPASLPGKCGWRAGRCWPSAACFCLPGAIRKPCAPCWPSPPSR